MAKKTYQVESPVRHDGKDCSIGDQIDLEDKDASGLLDVKAISSVAASASSKAAAAPADDAERIAAIVDAIGKLDKADASLWTGAGAPKTEAIGTVTGWPVAGKDRDAAWAQINSSK